MTIHMIGDSTMAPYKLSNEENRRGWGQMLQALFDESAASVSNHAKGGRSSKSFVEEGLWGVVATELNPGDWLIIQFGHNDQKPDSARHTEPFTTYKANLKKFAQFALDRGAHPVIATSIVRDKLNSHGAYPAAAIEAAQELNVPFVDLEEATRGYVGALSDTKTFYVQGDGSHPNEAGAAVVAQMFASGLGSQKVLLACYLK